MAHPEDAEAFDWDDDADERGNTAHLAESRPDRPAISAWEAEQVFDNGGVFVPNKKNRSGDWKLIGRADSGRVLTLVLQYDEERRIIRVFTGWDSTAGERSRYL
ncbi:hypothetical protein [Lentzea flaviverrucosa]|uniref:Uncharacterized protein n=1 Tax=Lentzea flaviverrucosa TaxID=200379 RepID=A0A1H9WTY5_9PSEU|nr:hypothetical protein [Lentzea flaviverrucosa]RDI23061.1 hypothetical protein DFR72_111192 [Lentzea flaviverrucosa]SES36833.1 hypothetical protein SAMN05216195_112187 [Lentzea flaviverrucosa]